MVRLSDKVTTKRAIFKESIIQFFFFSRCYSISVHSFAMTLIFTFIFPEQAQSYSNFKLNFSGQSGSTTKSVSDFFFNKESKGALNQVNS